MFHWIDIIEMTLICWMSFIVRNNRKKIKELQNGNQSQTGQR